MNNNVNFNGFIDPYQEEELSEAAHGAVTHAAMLSK